MQIYRKSVMIWINSRLKHPTQIAASRLLKLYLLQKRSRWSDFKYQRQNYKLEF